MDLSPEGVRLLSKAGLIILMILVTAFARTVVGPNPKRQFRMMLGTIGGLAAGIAASAPISEIVDDDVSAIVSIAGIFLGWAVSYQFIRHLPRYAD